MISTGLYEGQQLYGFTVIKKVPLYEIGAVSIQLMHNATGMEVWHIHCDDKENLFAYIVKTLPEDDRGLSHILEHCILRGSRRFNESNVFSHLLKSSMSTYLNAWTMHDKTLFIGSSLNEKDFYNLMLAMGDSVFFPLLREETFYEEAYSIDHRNNKINGVVFNEVLNNCVSPIPVIRKLSIRSVFPDTIYKYSPGGEPLHILDTSYQDVLDFHQKWYHPSNTKVFLAGDIPTEKHLKFLSEQLLAGFTAKDVNGIIPVQSCWKKPKYIEGVYPGKNFAENEDEQVLSMNWLLGSITNPNHILSMELVSELLTGHEGAILNNSLKKTGLVGEVMQITGMDTDYNNVVYNLSLKGIKEVNVKKVEEIIFECFGQIADKGIPAEHMKTALQKIRFKNKEIKRYGGPYTLFLLRKALRGWFHGVPPHESLIFDRQINTIERNIEQRESFIADLIRENLLLNPSRTLLSLKSDTDYMQKELNKIYEKAKYINTDYPIIRSEKINDNNKVFNKLSQEDIPREIDTFPIIEERLLDAVPLFWNDVRTNGIVYVELLFDLKGIEEDYSRLLPFWGNALASGSVLNTNQKQKFCVAVGVTGGVNFSMNAVRKIDDTGEINSFCQFSTKLFVENFSEILDLIENNFNQSTFNNLKNNGTEFVEYRNKCFRRLIPDAASLVSDRLKTSLSEVYYLRDIWNGVGQIMYLKDINWGMQEIQNSLIEKLNELTKLIISQNRLMINITTERKYFPQLKRKLKEFVNKMPVERTLKIKENNYFLSKKCMNGKEILITETATNFVGKVIPCSKFATIDEVAEKVLAHILKTGFLWERIRSQSGAYGVDLNVDGFECLLTFLSMRDPNINSTLKIFKETLFFAQSGGINESDLKQAIHGVVAQEAIPVSPGARGNIALRRHMAGLEGSILQKRQEYFLSLDMVKIKERAEELAVNLENGWEVILTNEVTANNTLKENGWKDCIVTSFR